MALAYAQCCKGQRLTRGLLQDMETFLGDSCMGLEHVLTEHTSSVIRTEKAVRRDRVLQLAVGSSQDDDDDDEDCQSLERSLQIAQITHADQLFAVAIGHLQRQHMCQGWKP